MNRRPRRNRRTQNIRNMVQETQLLPDDFIYPVFITEGYQQKQKIEALPGQFRYSVDELIKTCEVICKKGIKGIALFPKVEESLKNKTSTEALNEKGLVPRAIREIKKQFPELCIVSDIALDPFSSDGHDGLVSNSGEILNDETLSILNQMATLHASCGVDYVAPSDMMDGRVSSIRMALDQSKHTNCGIISYTAKYASGFYGPFRSALDSQPKAGDKKTYQMNPSNSKEALLELELDTFEGADMVMVKPALSYLDIIKLFDQNSHLPVAAYNVSGEYAMVKASAQKGWIDEDTVRNEILTSIKRAGADLIFSYFALEQFE